MIAGVPRTTPGNVVSSLTSEPPIFIRRQNLIFKHTLKECINRSPSYEIWNKKYSKILNKFPGNYDKKVNATYACFIKNRKFLESVDHTTLNNFKNHNIIISTAIHDEIGKKDKCLPQMLKYTALSHISHETQSNTPIYTDASIINNEAGFGIFCPSGHFEKSVKLANYCSISTAEMLAIQNALIYAKEKKIHSPIIFTDSLSSCTSLLTQLKSTFVPEIVHEIFSLMKECDGKIMWVPAHVGLTGNEKADNLAKQALNLNESFKNNIFQVDSKKLLAKEMNAQWQKAYDEDCKGNKYKIISPSITDKPWYHKCDLEAKSVKIINRLISNHSFDKRWLHRFGKADTEICEKCNLKETAEHVVFECKTYEESRGKFTHLSSIANIENLWKYKDKSKALNEIVSFYNENNLDF